MNHVIYYYIRLYYFTNFKNEETWWLMGFVISPGHITSKLRRSISNPWPYGFRRFNPYHLDKLIAAQTNPIVIELNMQAFFQAL